MYDKLRKLKLSVKALQALILIMLVLQQCFCSDRPTQCFGPVFKSRVYNYGRGFVHVNKGNKQIFSNSSNDVYLYKISTPMHHNNSYGHFANAVENRHAFYLFDPHTKRFLCWKNFNGFMTTMNYESISRRNHWQFCKFVDKIPTDRRFSGAYVNLELASHPGITMQFDKNGRNIPHKRIQKCLKKSRKFQTRHSKRCRENGLYLIDGNQKDCCREAYNALCKGKTALMPELMDTCGPARSCVRYA